MRSRRDKPRIGVDVDGVLTDLLVPMLKHLNAMLGTAYTHADITRWDIMHLVPPERHEEYWKSFGETVRAHDTLAPLPGTQEGMAFLQEHADVYIVTAHIWSAPTWVYDRDRWLQEHYKVPLKKIVHTHAKYTFSASALVDDKPANVVAWARAHPMGMGILWDTPTNRYFTEAGVWRRLDSWEEVLRYAQDPLGLER